MCRLSMCTSGLSPCVRGSRRTSTPTMEASSAVKPSVGCCWSGGRVSMDGKGRYLDYILVEHGWRNMKYEEVYLKAYSTGSEARRGIDAYLTFYNRERPHQSLDYRNPAQVYASGRSLECSPETESTLLFREAASEYPAGVSLNLAPSLSQLWGRPQSLHFSAVIYSIV